MYHKTFYHKYIPQFPSYFEYMDNANLLYLVQQNACKSWLPYVFEVINNLLADLPSYL